MKESEILGSRHRTSPRFKCNPDDDRLDKGRAHLWDAKTGRAVPGPKKQFIGFVPELTCRVHDGGRITRDVTGERCIDDRRKGGRS